jgi:hypothetical protein
MGDIPLYDCTVCHDQKVIYDTTTNTPVKCPNC